MHVSLSFVCLHVQPRVRLTALVTDEQGSPLVRRVICYDMAQQVVGEAWSDAAGEVTFERDGSVNDRYVLRAVGHRNECDDISCPMRGDYL